MGARLLVVDDNPLNRRLLEFILTAEGHTVVTASDALAALDAIASCPPRVILMDLQMPGIDGHQLARRLKGSPETAGIPIIAVTALAMRGDEQRALEAGCDDYVTKPIDRERLRELLRKHLDRATGSSG